MKTLVSITHLFFYRIFHKIWDEFTFIHHFWSHYHRSCSRIAVRHFFRIFQTREAPPFPFPVGLWDNSVHHYYTQKSTGSKYALWIFEYTQLWHLWLYYILHTQTLVSISIKCAIGTQRKTQIWGSKMQRLVLDWLVARIKPILSCLELLVAWILANTSTNHRTGFVPASWCYIDTSLEDKNDKRLEDKKLKSISDQNQVKFYWELARIRAVLWCVKLVIGQAK